MAKLKYIRRKPGKRCPKGYKRAGATRCRLKGAVSKSRKKTAKKTKGGKRPWVHVGGGCGAGNPKSHPCDEQYVNTATGAQAFLYTTGAQHSDMPYRVANVRQLARREGVRIDKILTKKQYSALLDKLGL